MDFISLLRNAFNSSDGCGKGIVFLLIFLSALVWCLIFNHGLLCWNELRRCKAFLRRYASLKGGKLRISQELEKYQSSESAVIRLCSMGFSELQNVMGLQEREILDMQMRGTLPRKLTDDEIDRISTTIYNTMASESQKLEGNMIWLGSLASIAPMLGLFGTVWGVMVTFIGIVTAGGRPDIQAIAPGISGALLTTVAGLIVAIPALFANNGIVYLVQKVDGAMDFFAGDFISTLKVCKIADINGCAPLEAPTPQAAERRPNVAYPEQNPQQVFQPAPAQRGYQDSPLQQQPFHPMSTPRSQQPFQNPPQPVQQPFQNPPQQPVQQPFQNPPQPVQLPFQNPPSPPVQQPFQTGAPASATPPFQAGGPASATPPFHGNGSPQCYRPMSPQAPQHFQDKVVQPQMSSNGGAYTQSSQQSYGSR